MTQRKSYFSGLNALYLILLLCIEMYVTTVVEIHSLDAVTRAQCTELQSLPSV